VAGGVLLGEAHVDTDEALVQRVRAGDISAFDRLYERYEGRLFVYLRSLLGDRGDAEEVLHDAFLAVLKDVRATLDREGAFRAWLYRVARNLALNRKRAAGRHDRNVASAPIDEPPLSVDARGDRVLEARQLEDALAAALARLPAPLGELWHLRTSGLSYEQIATVVDVPLGTVKSRMHQMVSVLREELKPWTAPA
jgi:RNA polymerase sigma-70 factor (ECF subfamily)